MKIFLGNDRNTKRPVSIPKTAFETHFHLIGGTGKGKTTALHTLLHGLLMDPFDQECFFIFDRLGNLSFELLLWMASEFCTEDVRQRLVYIEPAREDVVLGFNPLLHATRGEGYYKVSRATEIILRAWESVNIEAMPRLARWTFNAFWSAAQLGLTIADCVHFLMPGSPYHGKLLQCLPDRLKYEWQEIMGARNSEAMRILESSRNRLKPYFESDILRRMFGSTESRLDVLRFMKEGRIVLINLAPGNRLSSQLSDAIGALILNEVLATARSLPIGIQYPTFLFLDEFQNFVGPDMEAALPEVRQLGLRLLLSHQSFSQLKRGEHDLTSMIFQAQSRMIFGIQGEDADLLAHELASINYDPHRVKQDLYSRRQLISGHRIAELRTWSQANALADGWNKTYGQNWSGSENTARRDGSMHDIRSKGSQHGSTEQRGETGGRTRTDSQGAHESLVPEYEQFVELASRTFYTFEEYKNIWARDVRRLPRGTSFLRLVDDDQLYAVDVHRDMPGHLAWDRAMLRTEFPEAIEDVQRLIEDNFRSEFFTAPNVIDAQSHQRIEAIIRPVIPVNSTPQPAHQGKALPASGPDPFIGPAAPGGK